MNEKNTRHLQDNVDPKNRRQKYIINPAFQWKYALFVACSVFTVTCVMGSVMYVVLHDQARQRIVDPSMYSTSVSVVVLSFSLLLGVLTACGAGIWGAFSSHKLCGPLFVVEQGLNELAQGRFPHVRPLRKRDKFKDFFEVYANTVVALREAKTVQAESLDKSLALSREALAAGGSSCDSAMTKLVDQLEAMRADVREALGQESDPAAETKVPADAPFEPVSVG